jgi:hypothetical protein
MVELTLAFQTFPDVFPSDEIQGQAADLFKMMRTFARAPTNSGSSRRSLIA